MAVTSIWPIKGRFDQVITYVRNPEKTSEAFLPDMTALHAIRDVMEYTMDEVKTEKRSYVSGIGCTEETAAQQFMQTKRFWGKEDGRVCFHGYQSFREGEVTAEQAHKIGVALAKELWGDRYEVVVATHCNTNHYHNHFVINSVSYMDGRKFYNSKEDYRRMREVSDRLCREAKLSVIEQAGARSKHYGEWRAEKNGLPTRRGSIRVDIDRAIASATTEQGFIQTMQAMGYVFKTRASNGERLKYPALKPPGAKGFFRFHRLGEGYTLDEVMDRIYQNSRRQIPFPEAEHEAAERLRREMRAHPIMKCKGLRALYFRYCYELHIIVKHPTSVKRVSFLLLVDVSRMERYIAQTRLLAREEIDTGRELEEFQKSLKEKLENMEGERSKLRNSLKTAIRAVNDPEVQLLKAQIAELSAQIKTTRREVRLCDDIAQRSSQVAANLEHLDDQIKEKENVQNEHIWRSGGSSRKDVTERR